MVSIAININDVTYKKEERSFLSSLRNRLSSKIILPTTINTDNTRCKDFDFNNVNQTTNNIFYIFNRISIIFSGFFIYKKR